jgi:hypothetical protein
MISRDFLLLKAVVVKKSHPLLDFALLDLKKLGKNLILGYDQD